jgi:hypothetical protein
MKNENTMQERKGMQDMMENFKKLARPGAPHKLLAGLEGSWTTRTTAWMGGADRPPVETTGTCEQKMILGGRYLEQTYAGEMMGESFTGINLVGFDNQRQKFVSTWIDTMSTGIYYFEGEASADGKSITQEGNYNDPDKGPTIWRSVTRFVDANTLEYTMYMITGGKEPEKMSVMTVTRVAGAGKETRHLH